MTVGSDPRFEMFVYFDDVDEAVAQLRGVDGRVLKQPEDMFWVSAWPTSPTRTSVEVLLRIYAKCLDGGDALVRRRVQAALGYADIEGSTTAR